MRGGKKIGVCAFACILTPSPFGHSPYIPCRNTGGEVEMYSSFAFAPILYRIPRHAAGYGRGRGGLPLSLPLPVLFNPPVTTCHLLYILLCKTQRRRVILSCVLCLFFSPAESRSIAGSYVSNIKETPQKQWFRGEGLGV